MRSKTPSLWLRRLAILLIIPPLGLGWCFLLLQLSFGIASNHLRGLFLFLGLFGPFYVIFWLWHSRTAMGQIRWSMIPPKDLRYVWSLQYLFGFVTCLFIHVVIGRSLDIYPQIFTPQWANTLLGAILFVLFLVIEIAHADVLCPRCEFAFFQFLRTQISSIGYDWFQFDCGICKSPRNAWHLSRNELQFQIYETSHKKGKGQKEHRIQVNNMAKAGNSQTRDFRFELQHSKLGVKQSSSIRIDAGEYFDWVNIESWIDKETAKLYVRLSNQVSLRERIKNTDYKALELPENENL